MTGAAASRRARTGLASFVAAAALVPALARPAWALCPNCLGQNPILSPTMRIVGIFLLVPPAVFFFVARVIRRLSR
jgi:hypothetical protein